MSDESKTRPQITNRKVYWVLFFTLHWSLVTLMGCESVQRKFTRKSAPKPPPSPIINFEDYTKAMTPLDRYRKHYLMFDYWNGELVDALHQLPSSPKRLKRASTESLSELETMQGLLAEETAVRLTPLIEERKKMHQQLTTSYFSDSQTSVVWRVLEAQTRQIHREFFWRSVEEHLKTTPPEVSANGAQPSTPPSKP